MDYNHAVATSNRRRRHDLTGRRFGRLMVQAVAAHRNGRPAWRCVCDCGQVRDVLSFNLTGGKTVSCGCLGREQTSRRATIHGACRDGRRTPERQAWHDMMGRCHNKKNGRYGSYGGRGITVCERWRGPGGFVNFLADLGPRPSDRHSLNRLDNDGSYCPENCEWSTAKEQQRNMRSNVFLTHGGETLCVAEWAERTGLRWGVIHGRIRKGWSVEDALTIPSRRGQKVYSRGRRGASA